MTTTLRNIPQLPRPVDFIDKDGKFSLVGYSYLNELEKAVDDIRSLSSTVEGSVDANAAAIAALQESQSAGSGGGILVQRTERSSYIGLTGLTQSGTTSGGTPVSPIGTVSITPTRVENRIWVHGCVIMRRGSAGPGTGSAGAAFLVAGLLSPSGALPTFAFDWNGSVYSQIPFSYSALGSEWLAASGFAPSVAREFTIDLWAVETDVSLDYRIGGTSYIYAEEVTV